MYSDSVAVLPFHAWKDAQVKADSRPGCTVFREREWYWAAYGRYCLKARASRTPSGAQPAENPPV